MPDHDAIMEAKLKMIDETHRFVPKRSALLIIDMQHGFVDEGASLEVAAARDLIPNMQSLIAAFRGQKRQWCSPSLCMRTMCRVSGAILLALNIWRLRAPRGLVVNPVVSTKNEIIAFDAVVDLGV